MPAAWSPRGRPSVSRGPLVQELQQVVGRQLDLLVPPLGGAVQAGDQAIAVDAAKVAVDEPVAGLGLVGGALGQAEVPVGVLLPGVRLEERVLVAALGWTSPQSLLSTY